MQNQDSAAMFKDKERAASYDKNFEKLAPMRDALHLLSRIVLSELPEDARILCVGAGTGAELLFLAKAFPRWHFTAVEPAAAMLDICRERAEASGITDRCTFHEDTLDTLPADEAFDAATSLLVSHFIVDESMRRSYFREIATRLRPGGTLISADLASDAQDPAYQSLFETWIKTMLYNGMPPERLDEYRAAFGEKVSLLPPKQLASLIASAGFTPPVLFFQSFLMHGWYAQRA